MTPPAATTYRKKLIEVALPLEAINEGSKPETENPFLKGHPRSIHNWWARTPLSVCRAILFAQLIDDPSNDLPPERAAAEREKLLDIVKALGTWKAATDDKLIAKARELIRKQFNGIVPEFWDMFSGRGSIPLEAQRLGLKVTASDLNPVAVLIGKCLMDFPVRFAERSPVNPEWQRKSKEEKAAKVWRGAQGLAADVRYYGNWMRDEAEKRIGHLYPKVKITKEMAHDRPDLERYVGEELTVIAWLWARTVPSPNPALSGAHVPLVGSFWLSTKKGKEAWVEPVIDRAGKNFRFAVGTGTPPKTFDPGKGTVSRIGGLCWLSKGPMPLPHIRVEGKAGRMKVRLMAIVAEGTRGRVYLSPTPGYEKAAEVAIPKNVPDTPIPEQALGFRVQLYGMDKHYKLFTPRQLVALTTFSDLVMEARERVLVDARLAGDGANDPLPTANPSDAVFPDAAYADAVATYLGCALSRLTDYSCNLATWNPTNENIGHLFQRQAIPMAWDFAEANVMMGKLSCSAAAEWVASALNTLPAGENPARTLQVDARREPPRFAVPPVISTDPPYYDNIGYADLSDFFYVWLRRSLGTVYPDLFRTLLTPKAEELIATPYRHDGSAEAAERHFRDGFSAFYERLKSTAHTDVPITIYYAFKQEEEEEGDEKSTERASTGWETMLEGLVDAGLQVTGTLPVRTTKKARSVARDTNALASAIIIVIRHRDADAKLTTRKDFVAALKKELPAALRDLQSGNIAPVDLAQAAIGPGMAIYSSYSKVVNSDGSRMPVRTALQLINQALDEVLSELESEFDSETRWAIKWFEQHAHDEGTFGDAETLSKAMAVSVRGLRDAGFVKDGQGKVRLLRRAELDGDWDPATDKRLTIWEVTQHLIRRLEQDGDSGAAELLRKVGSLGEVARDLAYRLYSTCERKKWAEEARSYNGLVVAWPEIVRLSREQRPQSQSVQGDLF